MVNQTSHQTTEVSGNRPNYLIINAANFNSLPNTVPVAQSVMYRTSEQVVAGLIPGLDNLFARIDNTFSNCDRILPLLLKSCILQND